MCLQKIVRYFQGFNDEIKRYYWYNFILGLFDVKGGFFTMAYLFFHGLSVELVIVAIISYGIGCLIVLRPVYFLLEKMGPEKVFRLHFYPKIVSYIFFIVIVTGHYTFWPVALWMAFHALHLMLNRIPLTAYFSKYGDNKARGEQIGLGNNINILSRILLPIVIGIIVQYDGIILLTSVHLIAHIVSTFMLKFERKDFGVSRLQLKIKEFPGYLKKFFFFSSVPYPFVADVFSIYIAIAMKSFTILGIFAALRVITEIYINYFAGKITDQKKIRPLFFFCVLASSVLYILAPFTSGMFPLFLLQFFLGITGIITSIPSDGLYHNTAKDSAHPLQFAFWREVYIQVGLVIGCILTFIALHFVPEWKYLLPFGALSSLSLFFLFPYIRKNRLSKSHI